MVSRVNQQEEDLFPKGKTVTFVDHRQMNERMVVEQYSLCS